MYYSLSNDKNDWIKEDNMYYKYGNEEFIPNFSPKNWMGD
jgi:hypothetical protein